MKFVSRLSCCLIAGLLTAGVAFAQGAPSSGNPGKATPGAASYLPLPDGSFYPLREGQTPEHAWGVAMEKYPEAFGIKPPMVLYDADHFNACVLKVIDKAKTTFAAAQMRESCKHQATPKKCRSVTGESERSRCVLACKEAGLLSSSFGDCSKG